MSCVPTTGPGTASALAHESIQNGADLVLVAGGDGTINETINGMIGSAVPLAILPAGTANVLAAELGMKLRADRAALKLHELVPVRVAVGLLHSLELAGNSERTGSRYFLLMAGVGLDARIVYNLNLRMKASLGKLSYWLGGFSQIGQRLEEFDVHANDRVIRCSFALISRVRNYGGDLEIAWNASLLRDDFEAVLFQGESTTQYLRYLAGVIAHSLDGMEGVSVLHTRKIELSPATERAVYIQVDGEIAGRLPASVEIVPDALTVLVPREDVEQSASLRDDSSEQLVRG